MTPGIKTDRLGLTDLLEISDLLLRGPFRRIRVAGRSMSPTLRTGDQITVEPVSPADLKVGDLILFHHPLPQGLRLVCHRLIAVDEARSELQLITECMACGRPTVHYKDETRGELQLITKGDALTGCGETIRPDQVLGRVVAIRRSGGWWRVVPALDFLAMLVGRGRDRLTDWLAQGLEWLQGLRPYRQIMRALVSRGFDYSIGVPEGRRWYRYDRLSRDQGAPGLNSHQGFHLLAKLGGTSLASLHVVPRGEEYWLVALYVRLRYRGLGVASQLLTFACHLASRSGAGRLLTSVEAENSAALSLFDKMGFRPLTGSESDGTAVLFRDLPR